MQDDRGEGTHTQTVGGQRTDQKRHGGTTERAFRALAHQSVVSELRSYAIVASVSTPLDPTRQRRPYGHRNCASLFGYAAAVHRRSGGVCELCGGGAGRTLDFDWWRQLTVEHLIGESQGGYSKQLKAALVARFPTAGGSELEAAAMAIDIANTVTACSFCNSTTSRDRAPMTMDELLAGGPADLAETVMQVETALRGILERKRSDVAWKLDSVRTAFDTTIAPELAARRDTAAATAWDAGFAARADC
jgi:hypothetical protein